MNDKNRTMQSFEEDFYEYTRLSREFFDNFSKVGIAGKEWSSLTTFSFIMPAILSLY